jgi:transposase
MRDAREIIRLKSSSVSTHEIARRLSMARSTVRETLKRTEAAGLSWPLPDDMTDGALEAALYASRRSKRGHRRIEEPDWADVNRELTRKLVTLLVLWDEYMAANPGGYSYSGFCVVYRSFEKTLWVTMRKTHAAGERLFVDYAGDDVPVVIDRLTGEIRMAQIFVAVLGASSFTFAKASWTQKLPDWIDAHVRAFETIGGVPKLVVPDNAKTAIVKASFYDPLVNRTYAEMAAHYGTAILPARPRKPRDKAKVEQAVLIVERWLLGRLRRRIFYSLADVDVALGELMTQLNEKQGLRRLGVTRRQLLEQIDRPALKDLPEEPYEYSEWRVRRVGVDYHVDIDAHYYSVPYRFARAEVEARLTARGVEIFHKGERIAVHLRASGNRKHTTVPEHMPSSHRRYAGWTIERIREDARKIGPATAALCEQILEARPHPEQGYRACLGVVRLVGSYGAARVEAAAERAIEIGARSYGSVKSILDNKLDRKPARRPAEAAPILHPNIRGPRYYH